MAGFLAAAAPYIAGALSTVGGIIANRGSARQAREQMAFQERMSSTAYQRQKADLAAAGYNPALAYSAGGASSPGGAMAGQSDVVSQGVSSGMRARLFREELGTAMANREAAEANAVIARGQAAPWVSGDAQGSAASAFAAKTLSEWRRQAAENNMATRLVPWSESQAKAQSKMIQLSVPHAQAEANLWSSKWGQALPLIQSLIPSAQGIAGLLNAWTNATKDPPKGGGITINNNQRKP